MKINSLILILLINIKLLGCDCKYISKEKDFEISDIVFIGEIISKNDKGDLIKAFEVFKGAIPDTVLSVKDFCSFSSSKGDLCLIYANLINSNEIRIDHCGWSRSFKEPFSIYTWDYLDIPRPSNINKTELLIWEKTNHSIALMDLRFDIQQLRMKNNINEMNFIKEKIISTIKKYNQRFFLKWSIPIIILLQIILCFIIIIKIKPN